MLPQMSSTEIRTFFHPPTNRPPLTQVTNVEGDMMNGFGGTIDMGELVTREQSAQRLLSQAVYARWER